MTLSDLGGSSEVFMTSPPGEQALWTMFNPSIAKTPTGEYRMMLRSSNYIIEDDGSYYRTFGKKFISRTWFAHVEPETGRVFNVKEVGYSITGFQRGAEDPRLFFRNGSWHFTAVLLNQPEWPCARIGVFTYDEAQSRAYLRQVLPGPLDGKPEKNWMIPDRVNPKFDLLYSASQLYKGGKVIGDSDPDLEHLRGGSGLILQEDGTYLAVLHDADVVINEPNHYIKDYGHYFARFDSDGTLIELTDSFIFRNHGIEYAAGLVEYGEELLVSFGIKDRASALARVPKKNVVEALHKITS